MPTAISVRVEQLVQKKVNHKQTLHNLHTKTETDTLCVRIVHGPSVPV